jgi:hypothetical protein
LWRPTLFCSAVGSGFSSARGLPFRDVPPQRGANRSPAPGSRRFQDTPLLTACKNHKASRRLRDIRPFAVLHCPLSWGTRRRVPQAPRCPDHTLRLSIPRPEIEPVISSSYTPGFSKMSPQALRPRVCWGGKALIPRREGHARHGFDLNPERQTAPETVATLSGSVKRALKHCARECVGGTGPESAALGARQARLRSES